MKFLIFTKQVPDSEDIRFDRVRKTIIRDGVKNIMNAYDRRAISEAIRQRNQNGGEVVVVTMGPAQARDVLLESFLMGVDRAIHIQDRSLAGSDTLITAKVLAACARKIGFDLILCGQHSTDSETGQVPPQLAEMLGIPVATAITKVEYRDSVIRATCETDEGATVVDVPLPALLSTAERLIKPIKTKGADLSSAPANRVETWDLQTIGLSEEEVGAGASPTWVAKIFEDTIPRAPSIERDLDPSAAAARIIALLKQETVPRAEPVVPEPARGSGGEYWCLIEWIDGSVRQVSLEMLSTAAALASRSGGSVSAISLQQLDRSENGALLSSHGADRLYVCDGNEAGGDELVQMFCEAIARQSPYAILFPATSFGKYLAPRISARLKLGLTGDCVGFQIDDDGRLVHLKPAFGGNILASIYSRTSPQFATVRPGALPSFSRRDPKQLPIHSWPLPEIKSSTRTVEVHKEEAQRAAKLETSDIVICIGMGLGQHNLPLAFQLADQLDAGIGATRRVVDSGWIGRQFQIGLTGKFISPRVYLGLGVSGRFNHTIGIKKSHKIIAVNNDPDAEIWRVSDLGIVGDCEAVIKALIRSLGSGG